MRAFVYLFEMGFFLVFLGVKGDEGFFRWGKEEIRREGERKEDEDDDEERREEALDEKG